MDEIKTSLPEKVRNKGGRPQGEASKAVDACFERLGGINHMLAWAIKNPSDFYKLYSKRIPQAVHLTDGDGNTAPIINISLQIPTNGIPAKLESLAEYEYVDGPAKPRP